MVDADYAYRNIQARDAAGQPVLEIGELAATTTSTDTGNGRWDSVTNFRIGDVRMTGDGETVTLAKLEGSGTGRGVDMALVGGLVNRLWMVAGSLADETPPPEFFQVMTDAYRAYGAFDAVYRVSNIRVHDATGMETFALPAVTAEMRGDGFDRDAGNLDVVVRLDGLRAIDDGIVSVGGIEVRSATKGFKISEYAKAMEQVQRLSTQPDQPPDPELFQAMSAWLSMAAGGDFEVGLRDVRYSAPDGTELFRLDNGAFAAHSEGFDQDLARVTIDLGHGGLAASIGDPTIESFMPQESRIGIALENLPVRELSSRAAAAFAEAAALPPEEQEMAGMMFIGVVQQILSQANSRLRLSDWHLRSTAAAIGLDGVIEASLESMMGAVGSMQLDIAGLDRIIETAQAMSAPEDQDMLAGLEMLRGFSNRETGTDGAVVDRYAINLAPDGQVTINGKPFSLMGPMGDEPSPEGGTMEEGAPAPEAMPPPSDGSSETTTGN